MSQAPGKISGTPNMSQDSYWDMEGEIITREGCLRQAKKYSKAAKGCPTRQKLTQKIQLPNTLPLMPSIFSNGKVTRISGI